MSQIPTDILGLLAFIAASSGAIVSFLSEHWTWFQDLSAEQKRLLQFVISAVASLALTGLQSLASPDLLSKINAVTLVLVQIIVAVLGNFVFHVAVHGAAAHWMPSLKAGAVDLTDELHG